MQGNTHNQATTELEFHDCNLCDTKGIILMADGRCPNCKQDVFDEPSVQHDTVESDESIRVMKIDMEKARTFSKRMGRLSYFLSLVLLLGINFVLREEFFDEPILLLLVSIPVSICAFTCQVRRWHDLGKSGWNVLLLFIPVVNFLVLAHLLLSPGIGEATRDP